MFTKTQPVFVVAPSHFVWNSMIPGKVLSEIVNNETYMSPGERKGDESNEV